MKRNGQTKRNNKRIIIMAVISLLIAVLATVYIVWLVWAMQNRGLDTTQDAFFISKFIK